MSNFESNFRARTVLVSVQRHLAQQFVSYPSGDSAQHIFRSQPGEEAVLLVNNLLSALELEFHVQLKKSQKRKTGRVAA